MRALRPLRVIDARAGAGSRRTQRSSAWSKTGSSVSGNALAAQHPAGDRAVVRGGARERRGGELRARVDATRRRARAARASTAVVVAPGAADGITCAWFFAAARSSAGPPMSICSIASSPSRRAGRRSARTGRG